MAKENHKEQGPQAATRAQTKLPQGVKLLHTLTGHKASLSRLVFDPLGVTLASADGNGVVKLWEAQSGKLLQTLEGRQGKVLPPGFALRN